MPETRERPAGRRVQKIRTERKERFAMSSLCPALRGAYEMEYNSVK
jgi:hypothetical protein